MKSHEEEFKALHAEYVVKTRELDALHERMAVLAELMRRERDERRRAA